MTDHYEEIKVGELVTDTTDEESGEMLIVEISNEPANEYVFTWDSSKNPITVAEVNEPEYADDLVAEIVFVDAIESRFPELDVTDIEKIQTLVEQKRLSTYSYPVGRLIASN